MGRKFTQVTTASQSWLVPPVEVGQGLGVFTQSG